LLLYYCDGALYICIPAAFCLLYNAQEAFFHPFNNARQMAYDAQLCVKLLKNAQSCMTASLFAVHHTASWRAAFAPRQPS